MSKQKNEFTILAVPGPAIILTKEQAEKVKNSKSQLSKEQKQANELALKKFKEQLKKSKETELTK